MGKMFELTADDFLEKLEGYEDCQVYDKKGLDLYSYHGSVELEDGSGENGVFAVCRDCILTKKLSHITAAHYIETIDHYIGSRNLDLVEQQQIIERLFEKYQRTPDIPLFMQRTDMPLHDRIIDSVIVI